jgi:hypothetical protein
MATELLLEVSQDAEERARMRSRKKFLMDETSNMITAKKLVEKGRVEGIAVGRVEGRAEGRVEGRVEIFDLIAQGVPIDEIKKRFGL